MVSIRKYLEMRAPRPSGQADAAVAGNPVLAGLCARLIEHIRVYILSPDAGTELRGRLDQTGFGDPEDDALMDSETAQRIDEAVRIALAGSAAREREAAQRIAIETQHIVGVLNDALMVLAGGSERSISRLAKIQESLHRTSAIRDSEGLRASLREAVKLIREESEREQEHASRDLARFESKVIQVRERITANPSRRLPGRAEAIQALSDGLLALAPGSSLFIAAFTFDNIRSIIQRYGPEPVDELFFEVIRERVMPVAPVNTSWRWSPVCVVAVFEGSGELTRFQREISELCRTPLVYRITLGNRTAVLKIGVSHLVVNVTPESVNVLIAEIDRFAGVEE